MENFFSAVNSLFGSREPGSTKQVCVNEEMTNSEKPTLLEDLTIHCALFFDGTNNNKFNTDARQIEEKIKEMHGEVVNFLTEESKNYNIKPHLTGSIITSPHNSSDPVIGYPQPVAEEAEKLKKLVIDTSEFIKEKETNGLPLSPYSVDTQKTHVIEIQKNQDKLTEGRKIYSSLKQSGPETDTSFENDYSNIAILWRELKDRAENSNYREGKVTFIKLYIEGIGTSSGYSDSKLGEGWGQGATGIKVRANGALEQLKGMVTAELHAMRAFLEKSNPKKHLKIKNINININLFGFSRGAAAARYFIFPLTKTTYKNFSAMNELNQVPVYSLKDFINVYASEEKYGEPVIDVKVTYAGLFDTVASYGASGTELQLSNNWDLHLDEIANATKVTHICALDEYRHNFALTNIKSKSGEEFYVPGAHSDIGGGYQKEVNERAWVTKKSYGNTQISKNGFESELNPTAKLEEFQKKETDWLQKEGWALNPKEEIKCNVEYHIDQIDLNIYLKRRVSNLYSRIPLHILKEEASRSNPFLEFKSTIEKKPDSVISDFPDELVKINNTIKSNKCATREAAIEFWNKSEHHKLIALIRNKYFHFSADHRNAQLEALDFFRPRREGDVRMRKIHDG